MGFTGALMRAGIASDGRDIDIYNGQITAQNIAAQRGKRYYVDPKDGGASSNGKTPANAVASIVTAYGLVTTGRGDAIEHFAPYTTTTADCTSYISTALAWAKHGVTVIGHAAPTWVSQRSRIVSAAAATTLAYILDVQGINNAFYNLAINNFGSGAAALGGVIVSGQRNYFENCHMSGMGHATPAGETGGYSLKLTGSENLFHRCTIGVDTVLRSAANTQLLLDGGATRNKFTKCTFLSYSETAGSFMVTVNDTTALDRTLIFEDCLFYNFWANHADKLTAAFSIPASMQTCDIILSGNNLLVGIDEWDADDRGNMWIGTAPPAAATSGIAVEPAT